MSFNYMDMFRAITDRPKKTMSVRGTFDLTTDLIFRQTRCFTEVRRFLFRELGATSFNCHSVTSCGRESRL